MNLEIVASRIDMIEIEIPWMAIFTDSMKVTVSGVDISLMAKPDLGPSKSTRSSDLKFQDLRKLKKEALMHTEASYFNPGKQVLFDNPG